MLIPYLVSSSKESFTSASLAILVDEGKIKWDDKVIKYLPNFKMYNEYVTQDLLFVIY
jgi:CubicO group peptidase (beta-lactamase class C family)